MPLGKRKYVSGETRREVQEKLRQLQKEAEQGRDLGSPDQTLATWLETVKRTRAANTHQIYSDMCRRYIIPAIGQVKLGQLKPDHVQPLLYDLVDQGLSVKTASMVKGALSTALALAVKRGLIVRNVAALCDVPKDDAIPVSLC